MGGILLDTNVLLDIATNDPVWAGWSETQFLKASTLGLITINPVIYAELAPAFASNEALEAWLDPGIFHYAELPYEAGWSAGQAFVKYRRAGGTKSSPLPDFFIGAHAELEKLTVVTRDASRFKTYFPSVTIIAP